MVLAWLALAASLAADPAPQTATVLHLHFDAAAGDASRDGYAASGVVLRDISAGPLVPPSADEHAPATPNAGSYEFDGTTSLVSVPSDATRPLPVEGFTWEGFFLSPLANKYERDGAIGDRFISQFNDDAGKSTRLAVGLSAVDKDGLPHLCISLKGDQTRHGGKTEVLPDVWHHFAVVHEGTSTKGKIAWYLDYVKQGELELNGLSVGRTLQPPGKAPLVIGSRGKIDGKIDRGFAGLLDEIRICSRALAPAEFLRARVSRPPRETTVAYYDRLPEDFNWALSDVSPAETLRQEALSIAALPPAYSFQGFPTRREGRQVVAARSKLALPEGRYRFLLRTAADALLALDGRPLIDGRLPGKDHPLGPLPDATRDYSAEAALDGGEHEFVLTASYLADGKQALGEVVVAFRRADEKDWHLLGSSDATPLSPVSWAMYRGRVQQGFHEVADQRRQAAIQRGNHFWNERHELARQRAARWEAPLPPKPGHPVDAFLDEKIAARKVTPAPLVDDATFLRRATLDLAGRIPSPQELRAFLDDGSPVKREKAIDRLLASGEWADSWVGYWQDVLAENPSILKPTLNNSGPFRQWIYRSLAANIGMDRFVSELLSMEGDGKLGGTAGFAVATANDLPMAMKAHVVAQAFLGVDLKCARCHDSPNSEFTQRDLFSLAAMLAEAAIQVPASSVVTVPPGGRKPEVTSSLKPGEPVPPRWTLEDLAHAPAASDAQRSRSQLAEILTSPDNPRFSQTIVNRVWKRYFGLALVEPVDNWNSVAAASHPGLLAYLAREFATSGYDLKALVRLLLTSKAYQRAVRDSEDELIGVSRTYAVAQRRRLTAEQLVDSLFSAVGKDFEAEPLDFDPNQTQGFLRLGVPHRAWEFASLSNERDRPALALPVNQTIVDVLTTFGWRETRPDPLTVRDHEPSALQPLLLANGLMVNRVVRLSEDSAVTELALADQPLGQFVDQLFERILSRRPDADERRYVADVLAPAYADRRTGQPKPPPVVRKRPQVDWDRHLEAEASVELLAAEKLAREGDPPTVRLTAEFRQRAEDVVWCLVNTPEFVFIP